MEPLVDVICWLCEQLLLKFFFEEKHILKSVCMIWTLLLQVARVRVLETQLMADNRIKQHCGNLPPSAAPNSICSRR